jgi:hypothetical protein
MMRRRISGGRERSGPEEAIETELVVELAVGVEQEVEEFSGRVGMVRCDCNGFMSK